MYRGHKLLEVARHVTTYGESSSSNQSLQIKFDKPSWRKLHFLNERFRETDLYTQSRYHDTLNYKYPSVEAYTKVLEVVLIGDIKPKMKMREFKFDEVRPKRFDWGEHDIWGGEKRIMLGQKKIGLYHI
jgi:hypothetical protein